MDPELLKRITVRRAELDEVEEQPAKQLRRCEPSEMNSPSPNVSLSG
ncbi:hypothetical protein ACFVWY_04535 [Streptomyces sp. NPDC058195]